MSAEVVLGDCRDVMARLKPGSVDAIICDPPYEIGFMGRSWDSTGIAYDAEVWRQAITLLRPGGHLVAFGGSRTYHRLAVAIEDQGFEIRDQLQWIYASGFPKSHNLSGDHAGWGTALKPAHEPIVLARKPLTGTVAANVAQHGTGALNIDKTRIPTDPNDPVHQAVWTSRASGFREGGTGFLHGTTQDGDQHSAAPPPEGRWPANVLLDEEAGAMLDRQSGTSTSRRGPAGRGFDDSPVYGTGDLEFASVRGHDDQGGASRFFYCAKASRGERNAGLAGMPERIVGEYGDTFSRGRNPTTGERTETRIAPQGNHHPTVKPISLMRWLVRLICPPGGLVLDPFAGSGTTGCAAVLEGFRFLGIDQDPEYVEIARRRIAHWGRQPGLGI